MKRSRSSSRKAASLRPRRHVSPSQPPHPPAVPPVQQSPPPQRPPVFPAHRTRQERSWVWYVAIGTAVVFLVVFAVYMFRLTTTIEQQNQQILIGGRAFRDLNARYVELRNELNRKEELLRSLAAPTIQVTHLSARAVAPAARGKVFLDPVRRAGVLEVTGLPATPGGREYQLWLVKGDRVVSAGTFNVASGGSHFYRVDTIPPLGAKGPVTFAVTLEQRGGELTPAGPVYLRGSGEF